MEAILENSCRGGEMYYAQIVQMFPMVFIIIVVLHYGLYTEEISAVKD